METMYIGISVAVLIAILFLLVLNRRKIHRISPLTMLGMTLVVSGIIFSDERWIGYSLMGAGVLLAVIDIKYVKSHQEDE